MRAALALVVAALAGCPPADDDDATPRTILLDDDDTPSGVEDPGYEPAALPAAEEFTAVCSAGEPDDAAVTPGRTVVALPPYAGAADCGVVAGEGPLLLATGRLDHVVQGSWDGDNDTVAFAVPEALTVDVTIQGTPPRGDLDARLFCSDGGPYRDVADGGLASANRPEHAAGIDIAAGSTCALFVVAYEGPTQDWVAAVVAPEATGRSTRR